MKKEYSKSLKKVFKDAMKKKVPRASLWGQNSEYIFPGEVVYCLGGFDEVKVFVILIPNAKDDNFTVEVAWSKKGRFPELSIRPNDLLVKPESADEYSVRLPCLVNDSDDFWSIPKRTFSDPLEEIMANMQKPSSDEALVALSPLVEDCIQKLVKYGLPHVEKHLGKT